MHELLMLVILSISLTFIAFIISYKMIQLLRITHPKNRFSVYTIALVTAFSIFSFMFVGALGNQDTGDGGIVRHEFPGASYRAPSLADYVPLALYGGEAARDSTLIGDSLETNSSGAYSLSVVFPGFSVFSGGAVPERGVHGIFALMGYSPPTVAPRGEGAAAALGPPFSPIGNSAQHTAPDYLSAFLTVNLVLGALCIVYLSYSLFLGKKYILKRLSATKCHDATLLDMVKRLSQKLNIRTPTIFMFEGEPNALVFGHPVCMAVSQQLVKCLSREELRMAIYHELAHIKNRDVLVKSVLQSLRILFFYNPVVHVLYYKLIRERELIADSLYLHSKKDKITFVSALIKLHEYINKRNAFAYAAYGICTLSLFEYNPKRIKITERFNNLFGHHTKRSFYTILICLLIFLSNMSLISVARDVFFPSAELDENHPPVEVSARAPPRPPHVFHLGFYAPKIGGDDIFRGWPGRLLFPGGLPFESAPLAG